MAQPTTQNFLIHDANGKPQVIKVVHTTAPTRAWRQVQGSQGGTVRASSGIIKQLYRDDDDDSDSGNFYVRKPRVTSPTSPAYKVIRRPESASKVYQLSHSEQDSFQSPSETSVRLSGGARRPSARATPTTVKRMSPEPDYIADNSYVGKRRRSEKGGKGLRHFSMKVCQKVRQKGKTTYNEVADELVAEFTGCGFQPNMDQNYDQKNIRRRVYDALNVLMAMNIISKEKKEIRWLGLPTGYPKLKNSPRNMEAEERSAIQRVAHKKKTLQSLILQQVAFKNLVERNRELEAMHGAPAPSAAIQLPMLVVSTNQNTTVNCSVSNDRKEYFFNFDDVFEIKDESHVLQGMGMMMGLNTGDATPEALIRAKTMIPRALAPYLEEMVHKNVMGEASSSYATERDDGVEEDEEEGPIYLEEEDDDTATDEEMDTH